MDASPYEAKEEVVLMAQNKWSVLPEEDKAVLKEKAKYWWNGLKKKNASAL